MNLSSRLDQLVRELAAELRAEASLVESNSIHFRLEIEGRTYSDLAVKMQVGKNSYNDDLTKGTELTSMLNEWKRRLGYQTLHETKAIPYYVPVMPADEPEPESQSEATLA